MIEQTAHIIAHKQNQNIGGEFDAKNLTEFANSIYLHGKLETMNGYDLCSFVVGNRPKDDTVIKTKVYIDECTIVYATLFYWEVRESPKNRYYKGLVVMNGDEESMEYASKKYWEKAKYL